VRGDSRLTFFAHSLGIDDSWVRFENTSRLYEHLGGICVPQSIFRGASKSPKRLAGQLYHNPSPPAVLAAKSFDFSGVMPVFTGVCMVQESNPRQSDFQSDALPLS
jgi:hypothetical protein